MTSRYQKIANNLANGAVIILDGGVGTELERQGVPMTDGMWCGAVAIDHWDALVDMHRTYIDAGADVITTNTYASSRLMFEAIGLADRTAEINQRTVEAALVAREKCGTPDVLIAGSMSHMLPIYSDGTRPGDGKPASLQKMFAAFQELARIHTAAGVDLLLLEMMRAPDRMDQMFAALADIETPVWCGLAARRSDKGQLISMWPEANVPFQDSLAKATQHGFDVMGIMHTQSDVVTDVIPLIRDAHKGPVIVYPDSGHFEMPHWRFNENMTPDAFANYCRQWRDAGAQIIGGCCGLGPEHIAAIADLKTMPAAAG